MTGIGSAGAFALAIALTAAVLLLAPVGGAPVPIEVRLVDAGVAVVAGAASLACLVLVRSARHSRRRAR